MTSATLARNGHDHTGHMPPCNVEAERGIVGSLLVESVGFDAIGGRLKARDFHDAFYRDVFWAIETLATDGQPPDPASVFERLRAAKRLPDGQDGLYRLMATMEFECSPLAFDGHVRIVAEHAQRRRLLDRLASLQQSARDASIPVDVLAMDAAELPTILESGESKRFKFLTGPELIGGDFTTEWLIDGILAQGQVCGILGGFKCLKTLITLDLLLSLASGGYFLGYFKVKRPCRVAFMSGESGYATLKDGAARICRAAGIDPPEDFLITAELPQLANAGDIGAIAQLIERERLEALAIDPFYLAADIGDDSSNVFKIGKFLKPLADITKATGCTLIFLHHNRKHAAQTGEPAELSDSAGAGFAEFMRQWLLISRREKYEPGTGDHKLWLSIGGSAGHSGLYGIDVAEGGLDDAGGRRWEVDVQSGAEVRQAVRRERESEKEARERERLEADCRTILEVMDRFPEGETKTAIREASKLSTPRFGAAFTDLMDAGDIEEFGQISKGNNRGYPGFRRIRQQQAASGLSDADGCSRIATGSSPIGAAGCLMRTPPPGPDAQEGGNGALPVARCDDDPRVLAAKEAFPS